MYLLTIVKKLLAAGVMLAMTPISLLSMNDFPNEMVQKILAACSNKSVAMQVCKSWMNLISFKENIHNCLKNPDTLRTLHLTNECCFKIYPLIYRNKQLKEIRPMILGRIAARQDIQSPKRNRVKDIFYRWLIDDPSAHNLCVLDQRLSSDVSAKIIVEDILGILGKKTCDFTPSLSSLFQKYGIRDDGIISHHYQYKIIRDLCDILLCQDDAALEQFIKDEDNKRNLLNRASDVRAVCYNNLLSHASAQAVETLLEFAAQNPVLSICEMADNLQVPLVDYMLYRLVRENDWNSLLCDKAEIVLKYGAIQWEDRGNRTSTLHKIIDKQNTNALKLLMKYRWRLPEKLIANIESDDQDDDLTEYVSPLSYLMLYSEESEEKEEQRGISLDFLQTLVNGFAHNFFETGTSEQKQLCPPLAHLMTLIGAIELTYSPKIIDIILKAQYCPQNEATEAHGVLIHNKDGSIGLDTAANAQIAAPEGYTRYAISPLYSAILSNDDGGVESILAHDSAALFEANTQHQKLYDPVTFAINLGHDELGNRLLTRKKKYLAATPHMIDEGNILRAKIYNVTALEYAIWTQKAWLVERMLALGAFTHETSPVPRELGLNTILGLAKRYSAQEIVQMLERAEHETAHT